MVFSEDSRVKIPCILHLVRLGFRYLSHKNAAERGEREFQISSRLNVSKPDGMFPMALFGTYARFEVAWRCVHFRSSTVIEEPFPKQTVKL